MDLRSYYTRIRETEETLTGEHIVVVSLKTSEGGKAGVRTEVTRGIAARLIAEGRARVATDEEAVEFYEMHRESKERIDQEEAARRLQVMVIPASDFKKPRERN
jgi:molybdenum-dependent DNA-binding transcriptional regulator ModE